MAQVSGRNIEADCERTRFHSPEEYVPAEASINWEDGGSLVLSSKPSATSYGLASAEIVSLACPEVAVFSPSLGVICAVVLKRTMSWCFCSTGFGGKVWHIASGTLVLHSASQGRPAKA